jgi:hypothetical protein
MVRCKDQIPFDPAIVYLGRCFGPSRYVEHAKQNKKSRQDVSLTILIITRSTKKCFTGLGALLSDSSCPKLDEGEDWLPARYFFARIHMRINILALS